MNTHAGFGVIGVVCLVIVVAVLIYFFGIPLYWEAFGTITVDPEDQICNVDADCAYVSTSCDSCSHDAVNKANQNQYRERMWSERTGKCRNYSGGVCDAVIGEPYCDSGVCKLR